MLDFKQLRFPKTTAALAMLILAIGVAMAGTDASDATFFDNAMTHTKVRLALLEHVGTDALRIDIDTDGKAVVLSGTVAERSTVELAKRYAMTVDGVEKVDVNLEVANDTESKLEEAASELSDATLEAKVKLALLSELGKTAFAIEVEAADGVVALSGKVDKAKRELATSTAKKVTGVKSVENLLETKSS